jgi:hypothetical protein
VFEPYGSRFDIGLDEVVRVSVYGRAEGHDLEVAWRPDGVVLCTTCEIRAWNSAGHELPI